ncbi:hypothetical protein [Cellulosilyticum sp. I15G10I2]|uniref:hypothetical protein n=1 Tax=Cellulosilyticum sp. I15G10I2 TaxID=1892843 RepID=UPI00085BCF2B|nr:hypothetical protein [Cellulosilyticum sp. I15G10I2]
MAEAETKAKASKKVEPELIDVDELTREFKINGSVFAGVKMLKGWKKGRKITREEFREALDAFKNTSC